MEIKTKYNIGDRVWIIYESSYYSEFKHENVLTGEISLYDAKIVNTIIDEKGIVYTCDDENYTEIDEKDIILYEDKETLVNKIKEVMKNIHIRETGKEK
jgi:uncharacterized protein with PhoU and TrkA domain